MNVSLITRSARTVELLQHHARVAGWQDMPRIPPLPVSVDQAVYDGEQGIVWTPCLRRQAQGPHFGWNSTLFSLCLILQRSDGLETDILSEDVHAIDPVLQARYGASASVTWECIALDPAALGAEWSVVAVPPADAILWLCVLHPLLLRHWRSTRTGVVLSGLGARPYRPDRHATLCWTADGKPQITCALSGVHDAVQRAWLVPALVSGEHSSSTRPA